MRLATLRREDGLLSPAAVVGGDDGDFLIDLDEASGGSLRQDVIGLLSAGRDGRAEVERLIARAKRRVLLSEAALAVPVVRPPKILAAASNYQAHIVEAGRPRVDKTRVVPKLFMKPSTTLVAHDSPVHLPAMSREVDWELELAVVIGQGGRDILVREALAHVGGYSIINDVSARSVEWGVEDRDQTVWDGFFDWLSGKWFDGFAPFGPWIVTPDELDDPQALRLELRVNGQVRQAAPRPR